MSIGLRPRSLGEILDAAFRLCREDFGLYLLTTILGLALAYVSIAILSVADPAAPEAGLEIAALLILMAGLVPAVSVWAVLCRQMDQRLQGEVPNLTDSWRWGLRRFFSLVGAWILAYILFLLVGGGVMVVGFLLVALGELVLGSTNEVVGVALAVVFIGIMGIGVAWVVGRLFLTLPSLVCEDRSALNAVKRSVALTKDASLRMVVLLIVVSVLTTLPSLGVYVVTGNLAMILDPEAANIGTTSLGSLVTMQLMSLLVTGFTLPFMIGVMLLAYYDRRVRQEAYDLEAATDALVE